MTRPRIKTYAEAAHFLGRFDVLNTGQRGTRVVRVSPTAIAVRYHNTDVVIHHHPETGKVATIDSGGYATPTTVSRINEYAPEGWGARIYSGEVYLQTMDTDVAKLELGNPFTVMAEDEAEVMRQASRGLERVGAILRRTKILP